MSGPLSFMPERREIDDVPIEVHNKLGEQLEDVQKELARCRQKVAHLERALKEKEAE